MGAATPTFTPSIPASARRLNSRAFAPEAVKIDARSRRENSVRSAQLDRHAPI